MNHSEHTHASTAIMHLRWSRADSLLLLCFGAVASGVLVCPLHYTPIHTFSLVFSSIVLEAVPFMLLGALVGGLIEVFISHERMASLLPDRGWVTIGVAAGMGILFRTSKKR